MVKINENEVPISRHELFVLIGAAGAHEIRESQLEKCDYAFTNFASHIYSHIARHIWEDKKLPEQSTEFLLSAITPKGKKEQGLEPEEDKRMEREKYHKLLDAVLDIAEQGIGENGFPLVNFTASNYPVEVEIYTMDEGFVKGGPHDGHYEFQITGKGDLKMYGDCLKHLESLKEKENIY